jgi:hypothetical protein
MGLNPYEHRPAEAGLAELLEPRVDGKDFKPVYGPLLQSVQLAMVWLGGGSLAAMKLGACVAELGICWLVWKWTGGGWRWAAWAWCPLGIVEFWGMGHHDAWLVALGLGAAWLAERERWPGAYALLGLAAATKYWPLLLWPALVKLGGRRWAWVTPAVFLACWAPWWTDVSENAKFLGGFVGGWRNNDSLFGAILWAAGSFDAAKRVSLGLIAAGALGAAVWARTARGAFAAVAITIFLVSANVHPWYLTWVIPVAAVEANWVLLSWGALAPVFYTTLLRWRAEGVWDGVNAWRWAVYVPVGGLLVLQLIRRSRIGEPRS